MKKILLILLFIVLSKSACAYSPPISTCPADGSHANVYNASTNSWSCVSVGGGSMTWPSTSGLSYYTGSNSWGTSLQTINGVSLTGVSSLTVPAAAGTLTGTTLASGITGSSLTSAAGGAFGTNAYTSTAYAPLASPTFTGTTTASNLLVSGTATFSNAINGSVTGSSGTVTTISGLISAGSNVSVTGSGTSGSPYVINSTATGGGGLSPTGDGSNLSITPTGMAPNTATGFGATDTLANSFGYLYSGYELRAKGNLLQNQNSKVISYFDGGAGTEWVSTAGTAPTDETANLLNNSQGINLAATNQTSKMDKVGALDLSSFANSGGQIRFSFFVDTPANLSSVAVIFSNSNYASYFSMSMGGGSLVAQNPCFQETNGTPTYGYCVTYSMKMSYATKTGSPSWASIDKIRISTQSNGNTTVNTAWAQLSAIMNTNAKAVIIWSPDDSRASTFLVAAPIMAKYSMAGSDAAIANAVGTNNSYYMTAQQLRLLQNVYGWDIVSHTYDHTDLTTLTSAQVETEFKEWFSWADNNQIARVPMIVYPNGAYNATVLSVAEKYFVLGRSVNAPTYSQTGTEWQYNMKTAVLAGPPSQTSLATAEGWVDTAVTDRAVLILNFHNILTTPVVSTDWDTADFTSLVQYIANYVAQGQAEVLTYSQYIQRNITNAPTSVITNNQGAQTGIVINGVQSMSVSSTANPSLGYTTFNRSAAPHSLAIGLNALSGITTTSNEPLAYAIGENALQLLSAVGTPYTYPTNGNGLWNMAIGYDALQNQTASGLTANSWYSSNNTAIGFWSQQANVGGTSNVSLGENTFLHSTGTGFINNIAIGVDAGQWVMGANNVCIGAGVCIADFSGDSMTGNNNTVLGQGAFVGNRTGSYNVVIGNTAGAGQKTSSGNVFVGEEAGSSGATHNGSSPNNTAIGYLSMGNSATATTGTGGNSALGYLTLGSITTAYNNLALGQQVGSVTLTTGHDNILLGTTASVDTPLSSTANFLNIGNTLFGTNTDTGTIAAPAGAIGILTATPVSALDVYGVLSINGTNGINYKSQDTTAGGSIAIGSGALANMSSTPAAYHNTASGYQALNGVITTTGVDNTAIGFQALQHVTSGMQNMALGSLACQAVTSGQNNSCIGYGSGMNLTTSSLNIFFGTSAGKNAGAGGLAPTENIGVGTSALTGLTSGSQNMAFGRSGGSTVTTGSGNSIFGYKVASTTLTTGSNNILIGTTATVDTPAANTNNFVNIGTGLKGVTLAPTIASGFGNGASVTAGTTSYAFLVNTGTGGVASSGVLALATATGAPSGWVCSASDITTPASNSTQMIAQTATNVTLQNYARTTGLAAAWPASDVLAVGCVGY